LPEGVDFSGKVGRLRDESPSSSGAGGNALSIGASEMKISEYTDGSTPRIMVTVRVADRFFCGTLMSRSGDQATVLVDTPQGGVTAMTGEECPVGL
jgi:hypothetical protein